ncbi:MAG: hypothetical protein J6A16_00500 [Oscillospiraceae bacterium]|nr:hypothetical protein [Oscillospiraceae bacterium]
MKLSKQERIGVLIIAVIIILGLGIFFFIVPKFNEMSDAQKKLDSKNKEYQQVIAKADTKDSLKDDIITAYKEGQDLADMFFEELTTYQADQELRAFLDQCKEKEINVVVESLDVTPPAVSTLSLSFFEEPEITYNLKTYATQGQTASDDELEAAARRLQMMTALSATQDVASISVSFKAIAENPDEMMKFVDAINEYTKSEDGKQVRKAMMLNELRLNYPEVEEKYNEMLTELQEEISKRSDEELKKQWGDDAAVDDEEEDEIPLNPNEEEEEKEGTKSVSDSIYSIDATITFYSVERMQDPTDLLDAQDAA